MSDPPAWHGRIDRAPDGSIVGKITDVFGFEIILTGIRDPEQGGYVLTGRAGEPPAAYRVPAIDGEP